MSEQVREAIHAVRLETLHRFRVSMRTRERMTHQYIRERHGPDAEAAIPSYGTLRVVWREWFGPGGARQRCARNAEVPTSGGHVVVHRPGQVIALDTTILPVKSTRPEPAADAVSFILPGPITDRETVAGWRQWRLTRHSFVPAPRLRLADYRRLSPRKRQLYDLHRAATHANLPLQDTPMSLAVTRIMRSRLQINAWKHKPTTRPA